MRLNNDQADLLLKWSCRRRLPKPRSRGVPGTFWCELCGRGNAVGGRRPNDGTRLSFPLSLHRTPSLGCLPPSFEHADLGAAKPELISQLIEGPEDTSFFRRQTLSSSSTTQPPLPSPSPTQSSANMTSTPFDSAQIASQLTLEEACSLLHGKDFWRINGVPRLNVPSGLKVSDGPNGARYVLFHSSFLSALSKCLARARRSDQLAFSLSHGCH